MQSKFKKALALHQKGQLAQAQVLYEEILEQTPKHFDALHLLGVIAAQSNNLQRAVQLIEEAIKINPNSAPAYCNLGNALKYLEQYEAARQNYDKAIALNPGHADTYYNRGEVLCKLKQHSAALENYDKAIKLDPNHADAYSSRGNVMFELKHFDDALISYGKAISLNPLGAGAYYNQGVVLQVLGRSLAALNSYDHAIALNPANADVFVSRGIALQNLRQYEAALLSYDQAITLNPSHADAYTSRGVVLNELMRHDEALQSYNKAIELNPKHADAYFNRGMALQELKQFEQSLQSLDMVLDLDNDYAFLFGILLHTKMQICDWHNAETDFANLASKIEHNEKASPPFPMLALTSSLPLQLKAAKIWSTEKFPTNLPVGKVQKYSRHEKIRVGYFSADFHYHAVSLLIVELIEAHDRNQFEVFAFSFGADKKDEMRKRLEASFDQFIDVRQKSDSEIAELARDLEIDIAINLGGYTQGSRTGIFAMRAAPIQVSYLGYLGTMGAQYIDYLIADLTLIPIESQQYYTEKIVYLPSYQPNDSKRIISERIFTRKELSLPENGFVFCCFNNNYKITPEIFESWMRILKYVKESVLFLYADNELAITNLRKEAALRGVDSTRLVFGKRLPGPEYLARYRVADLFLDTIPYNAGTTASDALWAGLPVLTCMTEAFAGRMAASLLNAIYLPELITSTLEEFEALAIEFASYPEKLHQIKKKLLRNQVIAPLFDIRTFTQHIENSYFQMYHRLQENIPPDHIYVGAKDMNAQGNG